MSRPTLAQLEAYYWVARLGSFHAAARQLNLTQPSISVRIRELEQDLACSLFDRTAGKVRLTDAGRAIQRHAEAMMSLAEEIRSEAGKGGFRGLMRLGVVETVAHLALPSLVRDFNARRPDIRIELTIDIGSVLVRRLAEREFDITITTDLASGPGIRTMPLGEVDLAWLGPKGHALSGRKLTPRDLADQVIFSQPPGSTISQVVTQWFQGANCAPGHLSSCTSLSTTSELVAAGLGFAVLTPALVRNDLEGRIERFRSDPPIGGRVLQLAAVSEVWGEDVAFVGARVASALRARNALR